MVSTANSRTDPPNGLGLVLDFVNTADLDDCTDELAPVEAVRGWFQARGLLGSGSDAAGLTEEDRQMAIAVREALRALMLANNGEAADPGAAAVLEDAACRGELGLHFTPAGEVCFRPARGGVAGALAQLLVPVADAVRDGTWSRVKACRADDCQWAFYDRSRNRSGVWCDMAACGNRTKVRAYRARQPGTGRRQ
jgi:predicted RNA-binding Zn ribbon-like protein